MGGNDSNQPNRRSVLTAIGAVSATGLAGLTGAQRAVTEGIKVLLGSYNSPLSNREIQEARRELADDVLRAEYDGSGKLVAAVSARAETGMKQFVGFAGSPNATQEIHRKAREYAESVQSGLTGTQSHDGDDWSPYEDDKVISQCNNEYCPVGEMMDNYTLYHDDYDYWALHDRHTMTPGVVKKDSRREGCCWYNYYSNTKQSWSTYDNTMEMDDWEPLDGTPSNTSYEAEVEASKDPSVSLGWSFTTQDTAVSDQTVPSENYTEFDIDYSGSSKDSTSGFEPGSLAELESWDANDFSNLVKLYSYGDWRATCAQGDTCHTAEHSVSFYMD